MAPIEHAIINPRSRSSRPRILWVKSPSGLAGAPSFSSLIFFNCIRPDPRAASFHHLHRPIGIAASLECQPCHLLAPAASGLPGRLQNAAFNIGHWPATGLRPKPMPHQTRQSTNFSARASRRSLATERVSISRPIAGWIFAREIQHRAQPFGQPNLQIGSSRLAGYGLPPMMRSIPLR